jgi:hypothetical protein
LGHDGEIILILFFPTIQTVFLLQDQIRLLKRKQLPIF